MSEYIATVDVARCENWIRDNPAGGAKAFSKTKTTTRVRSDQPGGNRKLYEQGKTLIGDDEENDISLEEEEEEEEEENEEKKKILMMIIMIIMMMLIC